MDVYVVDSRLNFMWWWEACLRPGIKFQINQAWEMHRIALRIADLVPQDTNINKLRLCCHGDLQGGGEVKLGEGLNPQNAGAFERLRGRFSGPSPRIEVHACAVLSGTPITVVSRPVLPGVPRSLLDRATTSPGRLNFGGPGFRTMVALCMAAQVFVHATIDAQRPDKHFRMEGLIGTFGPPFGMFMIGRRGRT